MFKYLESQLIIDKNNFTFKESSNGSDAEIIAFLSYYEKCVYDYVKEQGNKLLFKYLQGKLPKNLFESSFLTHFGEESNYNIFFLTQHPSFVGGIVINSFLDYVDSRKNYIITYEDPIAENWLNSKVDYMDVINSFKVLSFKTEFKNVIKINFIRIFKSSLINFEQVNKGSSKPLFKVT